MVDTAPFVLTRLTELNISVENMEEVVPPCEEVGWKEKVPEPRILEVGRTDTGSVAGGVDALDVLVEPNEVVSKLSEIEADVVNWPGGGEDSNEGVLVGEIWLVEI